MTTIFTYSVFGHGLDNKIFTFSVDHALTDRVFCKIQDMIADDIGVSAYWIHIESFRVFKADGSLMDEQTYTENLHYYANLMRECEDSPEELEEAVNGWNALVDIRSQFGASMQDIVKIRSQY